jgi:hypothetical protein
VETCLSGRCLARGGSHITPPAEIVAQLLKRAAKCMWHPERVVLAAGSGGVVGGATRYNPTRNYYYMVHNIYLELLYKSYLQLFGLKTINIQYLRS